MSLLPTSLWVYLLGVPLAIFGVGFLLGSLPFSLGTKFLLSIVLIIGAILYFQTRVSRAVSEVRDDPWSFLMRGRQPRGEPPRGVSSEPAPRSTDMPRSQGDAL